MAVQLVSDEVHVTTGEPWRRWLDDGTRKRIREVDHACGWEAAAMEPGDYVNEEESAASPARFSGGSGHRRSGWAVLCGGRGCRGAPVFRIMPDGQVTDEEEPDAYRYRSLSQ
jgi:hypothetical protein